MRKIAFLVAAAAAFAFTPFAGRLGPIAGSMLLIALGSLVAIAASGAPSAIAGAAGALGAFASAVVAIASPAAAGAVLVGAAFAERSTRVRAQNTRLLHVAIAVGGGAIAGSLTSAYGAASPAVRAVSIAVASVLVALPLLVDADDPIAHALDSAADEVGEPSRARLRDGAELRRHAAEELLDHRAAREVRGTWASLLRLAEVRGRLERSHQKPAAKGHAEAVVKMVDQRIADHVAALTRAYTAIDTAHAAEIGIDDRALRGAETIGESLEEVSRAIVEDV